MVDLIDFDFDDFPEEIQKDEFCDDKNTEFVCFFSGDMICKKYTKKHNPDSDKKDGPAERPDFVYYYLDYKTNSFKLIKNNHNSWKIMKFFEFDLWLKNVAVSFSEAHILTNYDSYLLSELEKQMEKNESSFTYKDCIIAVLSMYNTTIGQLKESLVENKIGFGLNQIILTVSLKNKLHFDDTSHFVLNDNEFEKIQNNEKTEAELNIVEKEFQAFIREGDIFKEELKSFVKNNTLEDSDLILKLFDEETEKRCNDILKQTFEVFKNCSTATLAIYRQDGTNFEYNAESCFTPIHMSRGFTHRKSIPEDAAMWYIFSKEDHHLLVTTDVCIDLSVAYLNSQNVITEIVDRKADDSEIHSNRFPMKYMLEVPKGWFEKNNVKVGDGIFTDWIDDEDF